MKIWKENNVLEPHHFNEIQERVNKKIVPGDLGKLPTKIESAFDGLTAHEWKNFTLIFSIYPLKGILPSSHLECYCYFVIACQYICNRTINTNNLHIADSYLMKFCKRFEELYGPEKVTPNMHLHWHLKDCIMDMGPVYGFWLFSFERLVQILICFWYFRP